MFKIGVQSPLWLVNAYISTPPRRIVIIIQVFYSLIKKLLHIFCVFCLKFAAIVSMWLSQQVKA